MEKSEIVQLKSCNIICKGTIGSFFITVSLIIRSIMCNLLADIEYINVAITNHCIDYLAQQSLWFTTGLPDMKMRN